MSLDVDGLAARAVKALGKGSVTRRALQEVIAGAIIVGVNQVLDQAETLLVPERVARALSIRRHLGATTMRRLEGELTLIAGELHQLRLGSCLKPAPGAQASATARPPLSLLSAPLGRLSGGALMRAPGRPRQLDLFLRGSRAEEVAPKTEASPAQRPRVAPQP